MESYLFAQAELTPLSSTQVFAFVFSSQVSTLSIKDTYRASRKKWCIAIPLLPGQGENLQQSEGDQGHN